MSAYRNGDGFGAGLDFYVSGRALDQNPFEHDDDEYSDYRMFINGWNAACEFTRDMHGMKGKTPAKVMQEAFKMGCSA